MDFSPPEYRSYFPTFWPSEISLDVGITNTTVEHLDFVVLFREYLIVSWWANSLADHPLRFVSVFIRKSQP